MLVRWGVERVQYQNGQGYVLSENASHRLSLHDLLGTDGGPKNSGLVFESRCER